MQIGGQDGAIPLPPYDVTDFLAQEQRNSELAARVSAQLAAESSRNTDPFLDNVLASAWYRRHPEDRDTGTRSSDEVGDRYLVYFTAMVLKCCRARIMCPRSQDRGVVHERDSPLLGYHQQ